MQYFQYFKALRLSSKLLPTPEIEVPGPAPADAEILEDEEDELPVAPGTATFPAVALEPETFNNEPAALVPAGLSMGTGLAIDVGAVDIALLT